MNQNRDERMRLAPRDTRLIVFGDALSDTGNLFDATGGVIPPSPPYFEGRSSNGLLAVERLADSLGFTLTERTNFAIAGATTGINNIFDIGRSRLSGLQNQINQFSRIVGSRRANPKALYVVWAGWDDLLSRSEDRLIAARQAADNVERAVTRLADLGAANILVVQNPNLGGVPFSLRQRRFRSLTRNVLVFNERLETTLTALDNSADDLNIILSNLFPIGEKIRQNPSDFGFSNIVRPYLRGLQPRDPLADPDEFLYWDNAYPTRQGHKIFASVLQKDVVTEITDALERIGSEIKDRLAGLGGDDRLDGLGGGDFLNGNRGDDRLIGRGGRDFLDGDRGRDFLEGGLARDTLIGGDEDDLLLGGVGADTLKGKNGDDRLFGGIGDDQLIGGKGVDFLSGGLGDDVLDGGNRCDFFVLRSRSGTDTIRDFDSGTDLLFLAGRLSEGQLDVRQDGKDTFVEIERTGRIIAILENVNARSIGASDFLDRRIDKDLLEFADLEEGAALFNAIEAELSGLQNLKHPF